MFWRPGTTVGHVCVQRIPIRGMPSAENERTVRLSGILGRVGSKAIYIVNGHRDFPLD